MSVGIGRHKIVILFWKKGDCTTVSFLEIHKWEPDIYIGFSPYNLTSVNKMAELFLA
jgi:hypothetical protein